MSKKNIKEIYKFIELFPQTISVDVKKNGDGFVANITTFPGCITQGNSLSELIEMVNDAVRTYFEVPEKYLLFMPNYQPPISLATKLEVFPKQVRKIELKIQDGAEIAC